MDDKIENNPSFEDFSEQIKGTNQLKNLLTIFAPFSKKVKGILKEFEPIEKIKSEFEMISKSPDIFNNFFSDDGWIAHESMNHELMLNCIELANSGKKDVAENKLADFYSSEELKWQISWMYAVPELRKRNELINYAYQDTLEKKFYSAIPLLLMIIDGIVNDIDKNKGFFTESTDLTAWDSVAAQSSGLLKIRDIFNVTRKSTNEDEIFLPYRNGILHGRELNYSNKYVLAKCWLTLSAISDWAKVLKKNKENPPKNTKPKNLKESLSSLKNSIGDYKIQKLKHKEMDKFMDCWKSRNVRVGIDIPISGEIEEYEVFTPEYDVVKFLQFWKKKKFGAIAKQIDYYQKDVNLKKEAGNIRKIFENKNLVDFKIISITHTSPALCDIELEINFNFENENYLKNVKFRLIYKSENNESLVFGQENGNWKIIGDYMFSDIKYP